MPAQSELRKLTLIPQFIDHPYKVAGAGLEIIIYLCMYVCMYVYRHINTALRLTKSFPPSSPEVDNARFGA